MHDLANGKRTRLDHALAHAARGFFVIPLKPNSKVPAVMGWPEWATRDPQKIAAHWDAHPEHNIGIATEPSRLVVLDVDVKNGKRGEESLARLELLDSVPVTLEQITPSGGRHLIFKAAKLVASGTDVFLNGIDVKSLGGYIVGAGSEIDGKRYELRERPIAECAPFILSQCKQSRTRTRGEHPKEPRPEVDQEYAKRRAIEYLATAELAIENSGGDAQTIRVACGIRDFGVSEEDCWNLMLDHWNPRCEPPWSPEDLQTKVANAYRYAQNEIGVLAPEGVFGPVLPEAHSVDEADPNKGTSPESRLRFTLLSAITLPKRRDQIVSGLIDYCALGVLYGKSNVGKSFLAINLGYAVASGTPFFGHETQQGAVLYIAAEGAAGFSLRLLAVKEHYGVRDLRFPFAYVASSVNLAGRGDDVEHIIKVAREFAASVGCRVTLIIIDTLAQVMVGADENSGRDMMQVVKNLDRIRAATSAAVMVVHHSGKREDKGARGHSSLRGAIEFEFEVTRPNKSSLGKLIVTKLRDNEFPDPKEFRLRSITLGQDEDGKPIAAAVAEPVASDPNFPPVRPRAGTAADRALTLLEQMQSERGEAYVSRDPTKPAPRGGKAVRRDTWRAAFLSQRDLSHLAPDSRRKKLLRTMRDIAPFIVEDGECVYVPVG